MLKESQRKYLRGLGHALKPVVTVGDKGLTASVLAEGENALAHHELIKVRLRTGDRALRDALIDELCKKSGADLVQRTGNIALLYRRNPEAGKIRLPAA
jgi:RNA-binding protein